MQETNSTAYGAEAASKVHKELKKIGGVKPPREFVFMDRGCYRTRVSLSSFKCRKINWYELFHSLIEDFKR